MQYRKVPKNGDDLSILGFGCMRLPTKDGHIDEQRAIKQIRTAIDRGINYVDTAWPYHAGESEPLVGRALQEGYRQRVKLATKLPSFLVKTREDMDGYLNAQLQKLQTDMIDYYLVHTLTGPVWDTMVKLGIHEFLDQAKADGRIINAGFSFHGLPEDFNRIVDAYPWDFCQIQYNYLDEDYQAGKAGLEYAAGEGLAVIVMEPLRGGSLGRPVAPPEVAAIWNQAPTPRTPVAWALLWLWHHPEVTCILSGMNEEAHIDENIALATAATPGMLTEHEKALVAAAAETYRSLMKVNCTGCGYCMPCPANVNIPICFEMFNNLHMFKSEIAKMGYAFRMGGDLTGGVAGYASQCVQCGQCIEKCPQNIAIPEVLTAVERDMEGPDLSERLTIARRNMLKTLA